MYQHVLLTTHVTYHGCVPDIRDIIDEADVHYVYTHDPPLSFVPSVYNDTACLAFVMQRFWAGRASIAA